MDQRKNTLFNSLSRAIRRRLSIGSKTKTTDEPDPAAMDDHEEVAHAPSLPPEAVELMQFHASLSVLQDQNIYVDFSNSGGATMANERRALSKHGYYFGPITVQAAQRKLNGKRNGSFLVRDSHTGPFFFSISFRSAGCTLHTRIEFIGGYFTIFADRRYKTMVDLIEDTMREDGILCYVPSSSRMGPDFPIQLKHPVSRFVETSLQHQCRVCIRNHLDQTGGRIEELPLPNLLIEYLSEATFDVL